MNLTSHLAQLVIPINLFMVLVGMGVILVTMRRRRTGVALMVAGTGWILFWSVPASSLWLGGHLEQRYGYVPADQLPEAQAIVVLGGHTANNRQNWFLPYTPNTTSSRVDRAAQLYQQQRAPVLVVSGAALDGAFSEAQMMARSLQQQYVPEDAVLMETESLTTHENGVYTAQLLKQQNLTSFLLVTSALHMPRAMAVFRQQGLEPIPAGALPQITVPQGTRFYSWLPSWRALEASRSIIKEYAAFLIYRLRGWI